MIVMISYEPLWNTLKQKSVSQYELINKYNFQPDSYPGFVLIPMYQHILLTDCAKYLIAV